MIWLSEVLFTDEMKRSMSMHSTRACIKTLYVLLSLSSDELNANSRSAELSTRNMKSFFKLQRQKRTVDGKKKSRLIIFGLGELKNWYKHVNHLEIYSRETITG